VRTEPRRLLVVENDPSDDPRRLGAWLTGAGLELVVLRPHAGDSVPEEIVPEATGYGGLVVLGGAQDAFPADDGTPGAPWFPALERLLARSVAARLPVFAVCLGAQQLARATGGQVGRSEYAEIGAMLIAKRDVAEHDDLFAGVPFTPDVVHWHRDEITELPPGATLLAAGTRVPVQAFRVDDRAWGVQFHPEIDLDMIASWADDDAETLARLGLDRDAVLAGVADRLDDLEEVWRPVAERFASVVRGTQGTRPLPLVT
jgi:GMP synthase-like glutamine amidotransferase